MPPSPSASSTPTAPPAAGRCTTAHGVVQTPAFMPVGTRGAVKGVTPAGPARGRRRDHPRQHLSPVAAARRRPDRAASAASTASSGWDGPILTDSGGFQAFSLGAQRVITEEGIRFRSHLDGSEHLLTPGRRHRHPGAPRARTSRWCSTSAWPSRRRLAAVRESTERSARWARRCRDRFLRSPNGVSASAKPDVPIGADGHQPRPGAVRHHPGRRRSPSCGRSASSGRSPSASRPTPSAASASASRPTPCTRSSATRPRCCPPTGRAT